jgi:hypothetical protein
MESPKQQMINSTEKEYLILNIISDLVGACNLWKNMFGDFVFRKI